MLSRLRINNYRYFSSYNLYNFNNTLIKTINIDKEYLQLIKNKVKKDQKQIKNMLPIDLYKNYDKIISCNITTNTNVNTKQPIKIYVKKNIDIKLPQTLTFENIFLQFITDNTLFDITIKK